MTQVFYFTIMKINKKAQRKRITRGDDMSLIYALIHLAHELFSGRLM